MLNANVMEEDIKRIHETDQILAATMIGMIIQIWVNKLGLDRLTKIYDEIGRKYEIDGDVLKVDYEGTWYKALLPTGGHYENLQTNQSH